MSEQEPENGGTQVTPAANTPSAPSGSPAPTATSDQTEGPKSNDTIYMYNPETGGVTTTRRSSFRDVWAQKGWQEINLENSSAVQDLAAANSVKYPEGSSNKNIVELVIANQRQNKEL